MYSEWSMASEVILRAASDADVAAITAIYAHHVLHGTGTFELTPPDEGEIRGRLRAIDERGLPWLVAERAGEVVGYAYAGPFRTRPAYDWIVEDSVYVREDWSGRGVGTALLRDVIDQCVELGYRQMVSLIGDSANEGSVRLHRRLGFEEVGTFRSVGWKQGRWLDVVMMQKELGAGDKESAGERPLGIVLP